MALFLHVASNVAAAALGIVMTSPFGSLSMPDKVSVPPAQSGYSITAASREGTPIGEFRQRGPARVSLEDLPENLVDAVIATEDSRFLEHRGIDPRGLGAAALDTLRGKVRGGSTLTQQLAKNALIGNDRSVGRKILEALVATRIEARLSKRSILETYFETVWLGRGETGFAMASRDWLGKEWSEVTLAESAMFAAMLKGPVLYDPFQNPDLVKARRNMVLGRMRTLGWITEPEYAGAISEPINVLAPEERADGDPWERSALAYDLASRSDLPQSGQAVSTLDPRWQSLTQNVLAERIRSLSPPKSPKRIGSDRIAGLVADGDLARLPDDLRIDLPPDSDYQTGLLLARSGAGWDILVGRHGITRGAALQNPHPGWRPEIGDIIPLRRNDDLGGAISFSAALPTQIEAAAILVDPRSGEIIASIGGIDPGLSTYDRTRASRQPGSAIKPFLYLAALGLGFDAYSTVEDREYDWIMGSGEIWHPKNYDDRELGDIPMYAALERSSNLAAAWLVDRIGIEAMGQVAEAAGVYPAARMRRLPSAALGTSETSLRELVSGFGALVNDGMPRKPHAIAQITDDTKAPLPSDYRMPGPIAGRAALDQLLSMMRGVTLRGTASSAFAQSIIPVAGKTGTTQDHRDAWFVGVTPHLAIGIWVGRDDNTPLPSKMAGGSSAAPIAAAILEKALSEGLIDSMGLRDGDVTSSTTWPPKVFGEAEPAGQARQNSEVDDPVIDATAGFWSVTEDRRLRR